MSDNANLRNSYQNYEKKQFIEGILDGMADWVRVLDREDNIVFANKAMSESLGRNLSGIKCYYAIGKGSPCENCTSRMSIFYGGSHTKEETIGDKVYSVRSSPVKNADNEIIAVVEVLRDITELKNLQEKISIQNQKLQADLNIARRLQCSLLPRHTSDARIDFSFLYRPCEALGGDFVDIFNIDENHKGVYIADVSGHGVSASMLTVFLRSTIDKKNLDPADTLKKLYEEFNRSNFDQDLYITVFFAVIDLSGKRITYSNAGHNVSPIIFSNDRFELLRVPGIPICDWLEAPVYINKTAELLPNDRIFLYTDGIVEVKNPDNEQYGEERLLEVLFGKSYSPSLMLDMVIQSVSEFSEFDNLSGLSDDITMALLEIK